MDTQNHTKPAEAKEVQKQPEAISPSAKAPVTAKKSWTTSKTLAIVAIAIVAGVFVFGLGWAASTHVGRNDRLPAGHFMVQKEGSMPGMSQSTGPETQINPTDGTTLSRLSGVVTQVSGNSFTISGNGTTKTITTTGSTTYNVSTNKVNVNDSVAVWGTDTNGTFTATHVRVLNAQ